MNRIKQVLFNHRVAIALAILASLIVALPQVYFRIDHKDLYQEGIEGIELLPDSPWSPRVREIQDGNGFGNIYQKDGKDNPYLFQPLGSMTVAYMGRIFSLDINNTILLSRLVLPFIVFLLIYSFVYLLSRNKLAALSSGAVLVLADSMLSYSGIARFLDGVSPDNFLRIARPVNPAMIYILLFGFLITFWLFYKGRRASETKKQSFSISEPRSLYSLKDLYKKRDWQWGTLSAILLGLNFYNYFYTWTYLYAFGGLLVLFLLIQKKWKDAMKITSVFLGALVVAIPYLINLYSSTLYPAYAEVGARFGIIETHTPLLVGSSVIAALLIFVFFFPKEDREKYTFGLAILVTPFVTMNQQILTGRVLQPDHYHWFFHKPLGVIFVFITIFYLLNRWSSDFYKKALAILIIVASIATAVFVQAHSYSYDRRDGENIAIERQKYAPIMNWLNENAEKEAVVFGNNETSHLTVIYTPLNVFYHRATPFASLSATDARQLNTMFSFYRLRNVGASNVRDIFFKERDVISKEIHGIYYKKLFGSYESIPDEKVEEAIALYNKSLKVPTPEWLKGTWAKYEVEYVVWDKIIDPEWQLEKYSFLEEVAVFGDIAIYSFK